MKINIAFFLLFQLVITFSSAQQCIEADTFYKKTEAVVYCLREVLSTDDKIEALCIKKSDLKVPFYGEMCLLDSIMQYKKELFAKKIKDVKSLYVYSYLPPPFITLLAQSTAIEHIMFRPSTRNNIQKNLQNICLYKQLKQVRYLECADTSLALVNCLNQLEQLDTLVWLDVAAQNPYLNRLKNIEAFIIHDYGKYSPLMSNIEKSHSFNFPAQLKSFDAQKELSYTQFGRKVRSQCKELIYLSDRSGVIMHPNLDSLEFESLYFPPAMPYLSYLDFRLAEKKYDYNQSYTIPSYVDSFTNLKTLKVLADKEIILPASFYQLPNLEDLEINWINYFSDSIRYLTKLKKLSLRSYSMHHKYSIPVAIGKAITLQELEIYNRNLQYPLPLPATIYELKNLKKLQVAPYLLSDSIQYLQQLDTLITAGILECNDLASFPDSIMKLKNLRYLEIGRHYKFEKIPTSIFNIEQLETFILKANISNNLIDARQLKKLSNLKYIEFSTTLVRNEIHFERLIKALPEDCMVDVQLDGFEAPEHWGNMGLYGEYGWGQTVFTGIEFLHYISAASIQSKRERLLKNLQKDRAKNYKIPRIFDFHTLSLGVEWNYLQSTDFLMGYRFGYNYTRIKEPISFQVDFIAYTNYKEALDLRLVPRVSIPIKTPVMLIYLYYNYKIPLIAEQEQQLVARHNIGLNFRFTTDWWQYILPRVSLGF